MKYVALLRGINVGGNKKISMTDLRDLLAALGHAEVSTYIQSGNAVFTSPRAEAEELARELQEGIAGELGMDVTVMVRTRDELAAAIDANPFPEAPANPTMVHISFLSAQPDEARVTAIDLRQFEPDEFRVGDRILYLRYPNGAGSSKLTNDLLERRLGVRATARNWNTVMKLLEMMGD